MSDVCYSIINHRPWSVQIQPMPRFVSWYGFNLNY